MGSKNDNSSSMLCFVDDNQYNYLKEKLWQSVDKEEFTDILVTTTKDENYFKKVHGLILDCFCDLFKFLTVSGSEFCSEKILPLNHDTDIIDLMIIFLYRGKGTVPVPKFSEFMDLANYLKVSQIFVYDEMGSEYFIYLMKHKSKLLSYVCYIKKNLINCDAHIITKDLKCIPFHISILAVYSKKLKHYYKDRISIKNSFVLCLPANSKELEKVLDFCYYGKVELNVCDVKELTEIVNLLGIDSFLEKCKLVKKKSTSYSKTKFLLIRPPKYSAPMIIEKVQANSSRSFVYFWIESKCFVVPALCLLALKFRSEINKFKNISYQDFVVCLKNLHLKIVKKFISCLYMGDFSSDMKPLIDVFGIDCPYSDEKNIFVNPGYRRVFSEVDFTPLFANNVDELRMICDKVFTNYCEVDETIIQLFSCQTCGEQLLSRRALVLHLQKHEDNRYLCEICGLFINQKFFSKHLKFHNTYKQNDPRISFNRGNSRCSICNKKCKSNFWLQRHLKKHKYRRLFHCEKCSETFSFLSQLNLHLSEVHSAPFHCQRCTTTFKTKLSLEKHFLSKHSCEEVIKCNICDKVFRRMASLKIHSRTHTGEKPFHCKLCNKSFGRLDSMFYHVGKVHENKRYVCQLCNKTYSSRSYFLEHGWVAHKQFFDPEKYKVMNTINSHNDEDLSNLDAQNISKLVINQALRIEPVATLSTGCLGEVNDIVSSITDPINVHKQFFDPEMNKVMNTTNGHNDEDLSYLDAQYISKLVINQGLRIEPVETLSTGCLGEVNDVVSSITDPINVTFSCPICSTTFQECDALILHLDNHL